MKATMAFNKRMNRGWSDTKNDAQPEEEYKKKGLRGRTNVKGKETELVFSTFKSSSQTNILAMAYTWAKQTPLI